jgi:hypothetical protein
MEFPSSVAQGSTGLDGRPPRWRENQDFTFTGSGARTGI